MQTAVKEGVEKGFKPVLTMNDGNQQKACKEYGLGQNIYISRLLEKLDEVARRVR